MKRYGLSQKGLQSLFKKLVDAKAITHIELDQRASREEPELVDVEVIEETPSSLPRTRRVPPKSALTSKPDPPAAANTPSVYKCPSCGLPQNYEFKVCPQCGIIVEKFLKKKSTATAEETPTNETTTTIESQDLPAGQSTDSSTPSRSKAHPLGRPISYPSRLRGYVPLIAAASVCLVFLGTRTRELVRF